MTNQAKNKHSELLTKESILRVHLVPFFGKTDIGEIKSHRVEEYKTEKIKSGLSNKTVNNHLTVLKKCLNIAKDWEDLKNIPVIKLLKVPPQKFKFLSENDCKKLLDNSEGVINEMILLALRTGLRFGEIIALNWEDVDFKNKQLSINKSIAMGILGSTKSNKERFIPLTSDLLRVLKKRRLPTGLIFTNSKRNILTRSQCSSALYRTCVISRINKIGWHVLRHTFASHLAQKQISLQIIQVLLGHSDVKSTMKYAHLRQSDLKFAINVLEKNNNSGPYMGNDTNFNFELSDLNRINEDDFILNKKQKVDTEAPA